MPRDPGLAFSQNLVQNFIRFKMFQMQEEREARRDERYSEQLQQNQRRFDITEKRLSASAESLIRQRQQPQRGTKEWALEQGYSDKSAQLYQDRYNKLAPPLVTPYQRVTAGKMMMENAQTDEMYDAGELIMNEAMEELQNQISFPSRSDQTTFPSDIELQGTLPIEPNAGIFDRLNEPKTRSREDLLAEYRRLGGSKSAEARKFAEDNGLLQ